MELFCIFALTKDTYAHEHTENSHGFPVGRVGSSCLQDATQCTLTRRCIWWEGQGEFSHDGRDYLTGGL